MGGSTQAWSAHRARLARGYTLGAASTLPSGHGAALPTPSARPLPVSSGGGLWSPAALGQPRPWVFPLRVPLRWSSSPRSVAVRAPGTGQEPGWGPWGSPAVRHARHLFARKGGKEPCPGPRPPLHNGETCQSPGPWGHRGPLRAPEPALGQPHTSGRVDVAVGAPHRPSGGPQCAHRQAPPSWHPLFTWERAGRRGPCRPRQPGGPGLTLTDGFPPRTSSRCIAASCEPSTCP